MSGLETKVIVDINQTANRFTSSIVLKAGGRAIDAKSILGLSFSLLSREQYQLEIYGPDEAAATTAMKEAFARHGLRVEI